MSSKKPVKRFREVIQAPKKEHRNVVDFPKKEHAARIEELETQIRPVEMSSKKPVERFREVIQAPKKPVNIVHFKKKRKAILNHNYSSKPRFLLQRFLTNFLFSDTITTS